MPAFLNPALYGFHRPIAATHYLLGSEPSLPKRLLHAPWLGQISWQSPTAPMKTLQGYVDVLLSLLIYSVLSRRFLGFRLVVPPHIG